MTKNAEVYITGGSGQLGKVLRKHLFQKGINTKVLSRKRIDLHENEEHISFCLGDTIDLSNTNSCITFFHFAYDANDSNNGKSNINYRGMEKILSSFKKYRNVRFIYISTPNLNQNSTNYNLQKYLAETLLAHQESLVLRPSLIYSKEDGINKIFNKIRKFNFLKIPIPKNKNKLSPIGVRDFINLIYELSFDENIKGTYLIKGAKDMCFKDFLKDFHNIRSFYISNYFWKILIYLLNIFSFNKFYYLSERIKGLIELKDIDELSNSVKILRL